ncbi:MAG: glycerol-3-phosphate 1-O-acyltransferase PlsY [Chloroflexia bacterium]|nr:glycerol-3-phosphate 1-O-acyltransferase PlsY [Chloroflexia bacterium]
MPGPLAGLALVIGAFLIGAIPWGFIAGKATGGVDLRTVGSGSTGATNVLRTLGMKASALVLVLDFLKGLLVVVLMRVSGFGGGWEAVAGVAVVIGHCWSPFIGFRGGKGVATGAGAAMALFPPVMLAIPFVAAIVWTTKYVSLGSLVFAAMIAAGGIVAAATDRLSWPSAFALVAIAAIIGARHEENLRRLRNGTERRLGDAIPAR